MIKEMVIGGQRMAVRYVGVRETSVDRIEPCFMGMKGYVLCILPPPPRFLYFRLLKSSIYNVNS